MTDIQIKHDEKQKKFYALVDGKECLMMYREISPKKTRVLSHLRPRRTAWPQHRQRHCSACATLCKHEKTEGNSHVPVC